LKLPRAEKCSLHLKGNIQRWAWRFLYRNLYRLGPGKGYYTVLLDEFFGFTVSFIIGVLARRVLAEIRGRADESTPETRIKRKFHAAYRIDSDTGRVGRILYREAEFQVHGHIAEQTAFHPDKTDLLVVLPGNIV
jgi:hypothetical protein